jgi:hypothetical protein
MVVAQPFMADAYKSVHKIDYSYSIGFEILGFDIIID